MCADEVMDYVDEDGVQWVMAACGHHVGGGVKVGQKISLCPNCQFTIKFRGVEVVYPDRLEEIHRSEE